MRNFDIIMPNEGLNKVFESFFQDDENPISFGIKLLQRDLPQYQRKNAFRGFEETGTEWLGIFENEKYLKQTGEIYGCVSEKETID